MKKLLIGTSFLLGSFMAPSFAEEKNNFYLSVGGGVAFPSDVNGDQTISGVVYDSSAETDNPAVFSLGLGKSFNDYRVEFNYSKATVKSDKQSISSGGVGLTVSISPSLESDVSSYMVYGYKDFKNDSKFTPYAGIGLGIASLSSKDQTVSAVGTTLKVNGGDESVFSYALKGGFAYEVADNTSLYSEATYQNFGSYDVTKNNLTTNYDSTNYFAVTAGLRFNF